MIEKIFTAYIENKISGLTRHQTICLRKMLREAVKKSLLENGRFSILLSPEARNLHPMLENIFLDLDIPKGLLKREGELIQVTPESVTVTERENGLTGKLNAQGVIMYDTAFAEQGIIL